MSRNVIKNKKNVIIILFIFSTSLQFSLPITVVPVLIQQQKKYILFYIIYKDIMNVHF